MEVLKNCETEHSYILAELSNKCLKESCFQDCGRFHQWSLYLRMLGKGLLLKTTSLSLLSVVSKVFEKLENNRIVDQLEKCDLFSNFQYEFRSSQSTADLIEL